MSSAFPSVILPCFISENEVERVCRPHCRRGLIGVRLVAKTRSTSAASRPGLSRAGPVAGGGQAFNFKWQICIRFSYKKKNVE